jgi:hypothetical protein
LIYFFNLLLAGVARKYKLKSMLRGYNVQSFMPWNEQATPEARGESVNRAPE